VDGTTPITPVDPELLASADALRRCLELVYGFRLSFRGERREPTGTRVESTVEVGTLAGYAAAIRADRIAGAEVTARLTVDEVGEGGRAVGIDTTSMGRFDQE
jgi:hypothetical protein